jgi:hypothetical protein
LGEVAVNSPVVIAPAVMVVGAVAAMHERLAWFLPPPPPSPSPPPPPRNDVTPKQAERPRTQSGTRRTVVNLSARSQRLR